MWPHTTYVPNYDTCLGPMGATHTPSVGAAPNFWRSALQTIVAQSTCEAEYIVVATISQENLFVRMLLTDLGFHQPSPTPMFCNNRSAIHNVTRGCTSRKTRHISLKYHLSRDLASKGIIRMVYVPKANNCAYLLMKHVPLSTFTHLPAKIPNIFSQLFYSLSIPCFQYIMADWGCWITPICTDTTSTFLHLTGTNINIRYDI
jgi:hypothetical protein